MFAPIAAVGSAVGAAAKAAQTATPVNLQRASIVSKVNDGLSKITGINAGNNAWSAQQAKELRDWQADQARITREYNSAEAEKNRSWQKEMSDTAHQREIADLQKAGLNPVLSVLGGNGASTTSGATASATTPSGAMGSTDMSGASSFVGLIGSMLSQMTELTKMNTSAMTNLAVADKYNAMSKYTAELGAQTQLTISGISAAAQRYAADKHLSAAQTSAYATIVSSKVHAAAQRYGSDMAYWSSDNVAKINADVNRELNQKNINAKFDFAEMYPENAWQYKPGQANARAWLDSAASGFRDVAIGANSLFDIYNTLSRPLSTAKGNSSIRVPNSTRGHGFGSKKG